MCEKRCLILYILFIYYPVYGQNVLHLERGEVCPGNDGRRWTCELLMKCPQIGDFRRNRPKICSFQGIDPIICCPPAPAAPITDRGLVSNGNAEKKCEEYNAKNCNINGISRGIVRRNADNIVNSTSDVTNNTMTKPVVEVINNTQEGKVQGGHDAKAKEHRHMALIGYGEANAKQWDCGGSIISERWILSAAHCASPFQGPARWARVGDLDLSSTTDDAQPQEKIIIQRVIHPSYKEPNVYHDIALLKVDSEITFNNWVAPICLHTALDIPATKATVTGWGRLDIISQVSSKLQEVDISLVSGEECVRLYESFKDNSLPRGVDANSMVCAGEKEGGKDACSGDSGGPLVIRQDKRCLKTQIGITSFGRDCGLPNMPGIYTRVSYYIPWIESIVWPTR